MRKIMIACAFVLAGIVSASAQEKKSIDVATCSQMWKDHKASADYKDPGKGQRMQAWIDFRRAKCSKTREG
jgi:hypothetical protein